MNNIPVIAVFDVGKTNKKLFLFDQHYHIVHEETTQLAELNDAEGFPYEDLGALTSWVKSSFERVAAYTDVNVRCMNFSAYGASFVHINANGQPCAPLYNYLKPYPQSLLRQFYQTYGGEKVVAKETASPVLGSLNSGMQLYRLKYEQPEDFAAIRYSLHLPQYLNYLFSGQPYTDITSVGCHTNLWNFEKKSYHEWVYREGIIDKLAPLVGCTEVSSMPGRDIGMGCGLHDSSAALIPYLTAFREPFVLLSTGTWCISLNPFNESPLTDDELRNDCLCYLTYEGKPVKASRLFAGYEHEQQTKRIAAHFNRSADYYKSIVTDTQMLQKCLELVPKNDANFAMMEQSAFSNRDMAAFSSYEEAYYTLMADLVTQQIGSMNLVLRNTPVKRIFVDGGFSNNGIYMYLLAAAFPGMEVFAASVAQASAMGAALAIHDHWNPKPLPADIITLKYYSVAKPMSV